MNDFKLFRRRELSYILNNEKIFGKQIIQRIEEYCKWNKFFSKRIHIEYAEWDEFSLLDFESKAEMTTIKWTKKSYISELRGLLFVIILTSLMEVIYVISIFKEQIHNYDFYYRLFGTLFLAFVISALIIKREKKKIKSTQDAYLEIMPDATVRFLADGSLLVEDSISGVKIFWEDNSESGHNPTASLELEIGKSRKIVVFSGQNYLELFRRGNEICIYLGIKLQVIEGKSPKGDKIEL